MHDAETGIKTGTVTVLRTLNCSMPCLVDLPREKAQKFSPDPQKAFKKEKKSLKIPHQPLFPKKNSACFFFQFQFMFQPRNLVNFCLENCAFFSSNAGKKFGRALLSEQAHY